MMVTRMMMMMMAMMRTTTMLLKTADAVSKTTANMVMKFMATLQNGATAMREMYTHTHTQTLVLYFRYSVAVYFIYRLHI